MKKYLEYGIGAGIGVLLFLVYNGVDILPIVFMLMVGGLFLYVNPHRSASRSFEFSRNDGGERNAGINFEQIGGQETAKRELREALDFVNDRERIKMLGIRPLKGILLSGPPGTGKTLLAKAAANYTGSVFLAASGAEFIEMYVGVGAQRIRRLFSQAVELAYKQDKTSAVIFIDEIDVLGAKRGNGNNNTEHDQTLNELLVQMDGLKADMQIHVLVIAATNRSDLLDPALLRPGRFDRQVRVDLPDKMGRFSILKIHSGNKPVSPEVCYEELAEDTFGFSGAQLESVMNEAAIIAFRENEPHILAKHLRQAIDKVILGEKIDRLPGKQEKLRIAIHEAGHAVIGELLQPGSVAAIHVSSRSNALGYVRQTQKEDVYLYTLPDLENKVCVALAGFVAEEICLGDCSTGATNDFKQAANLAKQIVISGMSNLGIVSPDDLPKELLHQELSAILSGQQQKTMDRLLEIKLKLEKIANYLVEYEYMSGQKLREIMSNDAVITDIA